MKEKIGAINLLRFVAAVGVLLYHYMFMFYQRGFFYMDFGNLRGLVQYGYLGVDLFFIISGFVITLSAENRTWFGFITSRMSRLYPIFWTCVSITAAYFLFGGYLVNEHVSWPRYLAGLTMIPGLFGQTILEGSYWTLEVELKFYFVIFIILLFKGFSKIERITYVGTLGLVIATIFFTPHLPWIANFLAGMMFFKIYKEGLSAKRVLAILSLCLVNIYTALQYGKNLTLNYSIEFKPIIIGLYVFVFYTVFILIATQKIRLKNNRWLGLAGLLTYPVYLLHQQIGQIMFKLFENQISQYISLIVVTGFILTLSYIVHLAVEDRGRKMIQVSMTKIAHTLKLNP